eukprot:s2284_g11.t1
MVTVIYGVIRCVRKSGRLEYDYYALQSLVSMILSQKTKKKQRRIWVRVRLSRNAQTGPFFIPKQSLRSRSMPTKTLGQRFEDRSERCGMNRFGAFSNGGFLKWRLSYVADLAEIFAWFDATSSRFCLPPWHPQHGIADAVQMPALPAEALELAPQERSGKHRIDLGQSILCLHVRALGRAFLLGGPARAARRCQGRPREGTAWCHRWTCTKELQQGGRRAATLQVGLVGCAALQLLGHDPEGS